jgi:hypothetical protein
VIIGKRQQVELAVMTLMCGGCLLIEDAPGDQLCIISGEGPGPAAGDLCHLTSVHLQPRTAFDKLPSEDRCRRK